MNYLAHAVRFLDDPYFVAGTAVPDWLNVADRKVRVRSRHAAPFVDNADPALSAVARGIVQHHADDAWFHETSAFHELTLRLTVLVRDRLPGDEGFRPSFLGHVLVEVLLDAILSAADPSLPDRYYAALEALDPAIVQAAVNRMAPRPTDRLAALIPRFVQERFLWDYADDGKLWQRLNQVMWRVHLPPLPEGIRDVLPTARRLVADRRADLLTPP